MRAPRRAASRTGSDRRHYWTADVSWRSDALDLEPGVFTRAPKAMARSLKRSADKSSRRKASPFRSAMSMLVFFQNRAGRSLEPERAAAVEQAKDELRKLYGRPARSPSRAELRDRAPRSNSSHPSRGDPSSRRKRRKSS